MKAVPMAIGVLFLVAGLGMGGVAFFSDLHEGVRPFIGIFGGVFGLIGGTVIYIVSSWQPGSRVAGATAGHHSEDPLAQTDFLHAQSRMRMNENYSADAPAAPACDTSPPSFSGAESCSVGPSSSSSDS